MRSYNYKDYQNYIDEQKQHQKTAERTKSRERSGYIEKIRKNFPDAKSVLCVGARHPSEVKTFIEEKFEALGIDLFSSDPTLIKVVDMHNINDEFQENQFDLVFSCHSLEHSYDPGLVLRSFYKVSKMGAFIVLPISENPTAKDPCVFDFMTYTNSKPEDALIEKEMIEASKINLSIKESSYKPTESDGFWLSIQWIGK
jgi:2-polyprenyl-3-methyl-5-hydroxy-6-metoxy-1,4-benzoquinol methylase